MMATKTTTAIPKKYMMDSLIVMVIIPSFPLRRAPDALKTDRPIPRCPTVGEPFLLLCPIGVNSPYGSPQSQACPVEALRIAELLPGEGAPPSDDDASVVCSMEQSPMTPCFQVERSRSGIPYASFLKAKRPH